MRKGVEAALRKQLAELQGQVAARAAATHRPDVLRDAFPEERACVLDPAPLKVLFCTRRAAKSYSFGLEIIHDSYDWPGANYLFLALIREEAKRIFWKDVLKDLDRTFALGMRFNETSLTATMPNGATIYVGAADANEQEMRKLLGQRFRRVRIDEAQDWLHTDLRELVYSTLKPACTDYRGSISLSGTPGKIAKSFFRELTPASVQAGIAGARGSHPAWALHCWDTYKNTAIGPTGRRICDEWDAEIAELRATHPGIENTPSFRRQYLGEWVVEDDALVYRYQSGRNDFDALPVEEPGRWSYVLGIDLGYSDATAFALLAYHPHNQTTYVLEVTKKTKLDLTAVADKIRRYQQRCEIDYLVVDGSNRQAVEEIRRRHDLPLQAADKREKAEFIDVMNDDFIQAKIKLKRGACEPLVDEILSLIWDDKSARRQEHPACENHAADATLYAWRFCYSYLSERPSAAPKPFTPEWHAEQDRIMREREERPILERIRQRREEEMFGW